MIRISENSLDRERVMLGAGPDLEGRGNGAEVGQKQPSLDEKQQSIIDQIVGTFLTQR